MLRELLARPGVVERCELRARIGMMAFHGGNLERVTDVVADEVARLTETSLYAVLQKPPLRIHLASTAFDPVQSVKLSRFLGHVHTAVAIHGYGHRRGIRHHVLVGGRNRPLARHIARHLRWGLSARYPVVDDIGRIPKDLRGQHGHNPVNRPPGCGVQIELPPSIRWNRREDGWSDHQGISRAPDVDRLIDALTRALEAWAPKPAQTAEPRPLPDSPHGAGRFPVRTAPDGSPFSARNQRRQSGGIHRDARLRHLGYRCGRDRESSGPE